MKTRLAKKSDLEKILGLNNSLFKYERQFGNTFNLDWTYSETGKSYFKKRILEKRGIVILAEENGKTIGYLCGFIDSYPYRSVNPIAEIENMFVIEKFRNKKVGSDLVKKFEKVCKEKGVIRIRVGIIFQNTKAINFYKQIGFDNFELYLEKSL